MPGEGDDPLQWLSVVCCGTAAVGLLAHAVVTEMRAVAGVNVRSIEPDEIEMVQEPEPAPTPEPPPIPNRPMTLDEIRQHFGDDAEVRVGRANLGKIGDWKK